MTEKDEKNNVKSKKTKGKIIHKKNGREREKSRKTEHS